MRNRAYMQYKGQNVLMLAASKGHTEIVTYLLERGVEVDSCDHVSLLSRVFVE
jgi:ankyrin repeat protein